MSTDDDRDTDEAVMSMAGGVKSYARLVVAAAVSLTLLIGCTSVPPGTTRSAAGSTSGSRASTAAAPSHPSSATSIVTGTATSPSGPSSTTSAATAARVSAPVAQPFDSTQLDPRVTQGTIRTTIAVKGYTKRVRPPVSVTERIKIALMRQHGYTDALSDYELDHFIPLELGGSSNISNLWLEPIVEARKKDKDENLAHREVVSGAWTLARGQLYIRERWRIHYGR
jgi:hypothetical protein